MKEQGVAERRAAESGRAGSGRGQGGAESAGQPPPSCTRFLWHSSPAEVRQLLSAPVAATTVSASRSRCSEALPPAALTRPPPLPAGRHGLRL